MDDVDRRIIAILQEDGRASLSDIGQRLGLSHVSVRRRIKNLCEGLVRVSAGLNAEQLGLRIAIVSAEVETHELLRELIDIFAKCPRTVFVATTTGAYNLMTIMVAEDADTLNAILEVCSVRNRRGIRRSETIVGEAPAVPRYLPIKIVPDRKAETAPCGMKCGRCPRYRSRKCLACPATKHYRGPL